MLSKYEIWTCFSSFNKYKLTKLNSVDKRIWKVDDGSTMPTNNPFNRHDNDNQCVEQCLSAGKSNIWRWIVDNGVHTFWGFFPNWARLIRTCPSFLTTYLCLLTLTILNLVCSMDIWNMLRSFWWYYERRAFKGRWTLYSEVQLGRGPCIVLKQATTELT